MIYGGTKSLLPGYLVYPLMKPIASFNGVIVSIWITCFLGSCHFHIPEEAPFHVVDAMLNPWMLRRIISLLLMNKKAPVIIQCSNDWLNIHLVIKEMWHPLNSWLDLDHILKPHRHLREPELSVKPEPPPPFLVFVNKRKEAEEGCQHVWTSTPDHYLKD